MSRPGVRRVQESDLPTVVELVGELADHEGDPEFHLTTDRLKMALFGPTPALFGHVAETDQLLLGCALWFPSYRAHQGTSGIYLETLYVRRSRRGSGLGRALLSAVAEECVLRGHSYMEWSVVNQNTSAIGFYRSLGATSVDDQTLFRLAGDDLASWSG